MIEIIEVLKNKPVSEKKSFIFSAPFKEIKFLDVEMFYYANKLEVRVMVFM